MSEDRRLRILAQLARYTGAKVNAAFIRQTSTSVPEIDRFHHLISGIYKPVWSDHALSIVIQIGSPYSQKDEVVFLDDGRWLMTYSPRSGGLHLPDNQALVRCMRERVPVGVFRQLTGKADREHGSTYRVLGIGLITQYDADRDVFIVESADKAAVDQVTSVVTDEQGRYEVELYARLTNEFRPFVSENTISYTVNAAKRDEAFRGAVLREYDFTCSVCEMKVRLGKMYEATAAHIVPKRKSGTDDPRNGLALCRTHHWAFDAGFFSLSNDYRVMLSPAAFKAESREFALLQQDSRQILMPKSEAVRPHRQALEWHRREVLLK
jgi:hypothetical protein